MVVTERELWECVGPGGFEDKDTIFFAMISVYSACVAIEDGRPAEPLVRRVQAMSSLSEDDRYLRIISPIIAGVESNDPEGLLAAGRTALCAALMLAVDQRIWPRDWDSPSYKPNRVWKPSRLDHDKR